MTGWLPRSPRARRRLTLLAVIAPILALAAGLTLWGLRDSISYFYTPAQADAAQPPAGRAVQLGGLVVDGSVLYHPDGRVEFSIRDNLATDRIHYRGDLPDLFREGQGIVATGAFRADGVFEARQVLAKHDETYMPKQVADSLKAQGEWRGEGAPRTAP